MKLIKKHISKNYTKGVKIKPQYIVIHETDNTSVGADSIAHFNYWNTNDNANSSVHFVVDDKQVVQLLEVNERAWHVGDNKNGYSNITNNNSIGIEICVNKDGNFEKAFDNAIELVRWLMKETGINHIVRHYDASGKYCPRTILNKNLWDKFIKKCLEDTPKMDKEALLKQLENLACDINENSYKELILIEKFKAETIKLNESYQKTIKGIKEYINKF